MSLTKPKHKINRIAKIATILILFMFCFSTYALAVTFPMKISVPAGKTLTYTGSNLVGVDAGAGYNVSGTFKAKDVGTYTATVTPRTNYAWSDGTTTAKSVTWTIQRKAIPVPTAVQGLRYTGIEQMGVYPGTGYTVTGHKATARGNYTATVSVKSNYKWSDGTTTNKTVSWTIGNMQIPVPAAKENVIYNGKAQIGVDSGRGYAISGNSQTNVGSYTATATLQTGYEWEDGTTGNKTISWTINKRELYISAKNYRKYKGEANPTLQYVYSNNVSGQTPGFTGALSTTATTSSAVGVYPISLNTLALSSTSTFNANNYEIAYISGSITVYEDNASQPIHTDVLLDTTAPTLGTLSMYPRSTDGRVLLSLDSVSDTGSGISKIDWMITTEEGEVFEFIGYYEPDLSVSYIIDIAVPYSKKYYGQVFVTDMVGNTSNASTYVINKINITIKAGNQRIYDGDTIITNDVSKVYVSRGELLAGDVIQSVTLTQEFEKIQITGLTIARAGAVIYTAAAPDASDIYSVSFEEGNISKASRDLTEGGIVRINETQNYIYDTCYYRPPVVVTWTGNRPDNNAALSATLTENADYEVSYENNKNAGFARVIVTGIGKYSGTISEYFIIEQRHLIVNGPNLNLIVRGTVPTLSGNLCSYSYEAIAGSSNQIAESPQWDGLMVTTATAPLQAGDYPVTQGGLYIQGNNSSGFKSDNYYMTYNNGNIHVDRLSLNDELITFEITPIEYIYDGNAKTPTETVKQGNYTLQRGSNKDYTIEYLNNVNRASFEDTEFAKPTVRITGVGNYIGVRDYYFTISPRDLKIIVDNKYRDYRADNPTPTFKYEAPTATSGLIGTQLPKESEVHMYYDSVNVNSNAGVYGGEIRAELTTSDGRFTDNTSTGFLKRNYNVVTFEYGTLTIGGSTIDTNILNTYITPTEYIFDGTEKIPATIVHDINGRLLTLNVDYHVDYYDNINVTDREHGYNTRAVITGVGNYIASEEITREFTIKLKDMTGSMQVDFHPIDEDTGRPLPGSVLTADVVMVDPIDPALTYQWYRSLSPSETPNTLTDAMKLVGETNPTYIAKLDDYQYYFYCIVKAVKENYNDLILFDYAKKNNTGEPVPVIERGMPTITVTPTAGGSAYENGSWTNQDVVFNITATDNKSLRKIQYTTDGTNYIDLSVITETDVKNKNVEYTHPSETDTLTYRFRAIDDVGNISNEVSINIKVDKTAPVATSNDIVLNPSNWTRENVEVTASAVEISNTTGCIGSGISGYYFGSEQTPSASAFEQVAPSYELMQRRTYTSNATGQYFVIIDRAGNRSVVPFEVTNIDRVAPEIEVLSTNISNGLELTIKTRDNTNGSGIDNLKVNGEQKELTLVNGWYECTYVIDTPGTYPIISTDRAGNSTRYVDSGSGTDIKVFGIIYLGNGAPGTMKPTLKKVGMTVSIKQCEFYKDDGIFTSWNTKADGTGDTYMPGASYSEDNILTLYAQWRDVTYELDRVVLSDYRFLYTGYPITPQEKVYDTRGVLLARDIDYTISYENNVQIGTAKVIINGLDKYLNQKLEEFFFIYGSEVNQRFDVEIEKTIYVYDGYEKRPSVVVKDGAKVLEPGKDYFVEYKDNIEVGTATVTVTGRGEYFGNVSKNYEIIRADRELDVYDVAQKVGDVVQLDFSYTGERATQSLVIVNPNIATVQLDNVTQKFVLTGVTPGKTTMEYSVPATKNYNAASIVLQVTIFENDDVSTPLYGKILINDDAVYTNTPNTILTIRASMAEYMYLSTTNTKPDANAEGWMDYSSRYPYTFSSEEGEKVIYAWFKDRNGNISNVASDTIILKYDYPYPAHDYIMLDKTDIDTEMPSIEITKYQNAGINIRVDFNQIDVVKNGVRSGVNYDSVKYGYRENEAAEYTWTTSNVLDNVKLHYGSVYGFVTQAYDRAGNGPIISQEYVYTMPLKQGTIIRLEDKNCQYDGTTHDIDPATFDNEETEPITGTVTYTYYIDRECTVETIPSRDGCILPGGAPSKSGTYYVICRLRDDPHYFDTQSEIAQLRIGWYIHKASSEDIFAYVQETGLETDKYDLHIIGNGEMKDLSDIKKQNNVEEYTYWKEYLDKIVSYDIAEDDDNLITNIGAHVLSNLTEITEINIPGTIREIGSGAFNNTPKVNTKVIIPATVAKIGVNPFVDSKVTEFEVQYGNPTYKSEDGLIYTKNGENILAYPGGKIETNGKYGKEYVIPKTVKNILPDAFRGCDNLEVVVIPNGVKTIGERAFYDCNNLRQIEIFDLFDRSDNTIDFTEIGKEAFGNLPAGSSIYTFDKKMADQIRKDYHYDPSKTTVYWPPKVTLHPTDANGTNGFSTTFYIEAEDGYVEGINYQWFVLHNDTGRIELISGATESRYETPVNLTMVNNGDKYFCGVWNMEYYHDFLLAIDGKTTKEDSTGKIDGIKEDRTAKEYKASKLFSNDAILTMIPTENAYYRVERDSDNTQRIFDNLQDAFDYSKTNDRIRVIRDVPHEADATLDGSKKVELILDHTINMTGTIFNKSGSDITVIGATGINKTNNYIFNNSGKLTLNGTFTLGSTNGGAVTNNTGSTLNFNSGTLNTAQDAIKANNAFVNVTSNSAVINVNGTTTTSGINITGYTKLDMTGGVINVSSTQTTGLVAGIINDADDRIETGKGKVTLSGVTIQATSQGSSGVINNNSADLIVENSTIEGKYAGIHNTPSNNGGNVDIKNGTIKGETFGVLNNASQSKLVIGVHDGNVSITNPVIIGDRVAIFNSRSTNTMEFYDGILKAKGQNIVYEDINNTSLNQDSSKTARVYTATGRDDIVVENGYVIDLGEDGDYHTAFLNGNLLPELEPIPDVTVSVGEKGTIETKIKKDGNPKIYYYEWEVSIDNGATWSKVSVGTGMTTSIYTTPAVQMTMNGYLYRCKVTNASGSTYTNVVRLTVVEDIAYRDQRPLVRYEYNKAINYANTSDLESEKSVKMKIIIKSYELLKDIVFTYGSTTKSIIDSNSNGISDIGGHYVISNPTRTQVSGTGDYIEYTYTFDLTAKENGIITIKAIDGADRVGTGTQTIDVFYDLKVDYTKSELNNAQPQLELTFFGNRQIRPVEPKVTGVDVSAQFSGVDGTTYSYKWKFKPTISIPRGSVFRFEDMYGNMYDVVIREEIVRVIYRDIKFTSDATNEEIKDMTVIDAYNVANALDHQTEVSESQRVQSKYGVNKAQADTFMARARDVGAVEILSGASSSRAYDGKNIRDVAATQTQDSDSGYIEGDRNNYISAVAGAATDSELSNEPKSHIDTISKDSSLYRGADISDFDYNNSENPYMYEDSGGSAVNINGGVKDATFRAVIVGN